MLTFREYRESLEKDDRKKAMEVVRKGMNMKSEDFWDGFLSLCGNVDGMSALLGTSKENVTGLGGLIGDLRSEIKDKDSGGGKRDKMIKTGDET